MKKNHDLIFNSYNLLLVTFAYKNVTQSTKIVTSPRLTDTPGIK